jgi:hypothetical protein
MARVTIAIACALIALGVSGYLPHHAPTALIPAYTGAALLILGFLALNPDWRKHAMHLAAMIGLIGFLGAAVQLIRVLVADVPGTSLKVISLAGMTILTLLFEVLCVMSFVNARRSRTAPPPQQARSS